MLYSNEVCNDNSQSMNGNKGRVPWGGSVDPCPERHPPVSISDAEGARGSQTYNAPTDRGHCQGPSLMVTTGSESLSAS